jgi:hypothetical protein
LFGNRWPPQTTCAGCATGISGDFLPPSPPAEKATTSQDQAGQSSAGDEAGHGDWATPKAAAAINLVTHLSTLAWHLHHLAAGRASDRERRRLRVV